MAKRSVRKRRRMQAVKAETGECFADDCTDKATTTVNIDGTRYQVCAAHAELVMLQEHRRAEHRRKQQGADPERRRQTERALGLRP